MANLQVATDFEKIINADRDRKKNEALAARIFNRDRRASGGPATARLGGSLASRVGVKKRGIPTGPRSQVAATAGDINGEWTHDLHDRHSAPTTPRASPRPGSLASRITNPLAGPARQQPQPQRRAAQVAQALIRSERQVRPSASLPALGGGFNKGITIRGLAGPFVVMAQNFAPGTTAADIENAMTPVGGVVSSCRLLKSSPIVIAEIVFESKEGADNIIATFNNQVADGRVLHVYHKLGSAAAPTAPARRPSPNPPTGPRAQRNDGVVDGSMGFDDPMDGMDDGRSGHAGGVGPAAYANGDRDGSGPRGRGQGGLYSDNLVPGRGGGGGGGGGRRWTRR